MQDIECDYIKWCGNGLGVSSGWNKSTWMNDWGMHVIHQKKWPLGLMLCKLMRGSIMDEIHPTIEIHNRFPPSTPQYSPIDLCYTSEIYFYPQNFIPNWCCHIRIVNNIHSMEVHPMGSDSHSNIHFIRWMKSIHHGCPIGFTPFIH